MERPWWWESSPWGSPPSPKRGRIQEPRSPAPSPEGRLWGNSPASPRDTAGNLHRFRGCELADCDGSAACGLQFPRTGAGGDDMSTRVERALWGLSLFAAVTLAACGDSGPTR